VKEVTWLELEISETGATGGSWVWRVPSWRASPWASRAATAINRPDRGDPDPEFPLRPAGDLGTSRYDGHLDQSRRRDPFVKPWRWESGAPIQDLSRGVL